MAVNLAPSMRPRPKHSIGDSRWHICPRNFPPRVENHAMKRRSAMIVSCLLLLIIGLASPSCAEQCCCSVSEICSCSSVQESSCSTLCAPDVSLHQAIVVSSPSLSVPSPEPFELAASSPRPPKEIGERPSQQEPFPPPLFVNEFLCFLPPPMG